MRVLQTLPHTPLTRTDERGRAIIRGVEREGSLTSTCPTWRQPLGPKIWWQQLSFLVVNDTELVVRAPTGNCLETKPVLLTAAAREALRHEFYGHYTTGAATGDFVPCGGFPIASDSQRPWRRRAWIRFAPNVDQRQIKWPTYTDNIPHPTVFARREGVLEGPGVYGYQGGAAYLLIVDEIVELRAPRPDDCDTTK